MNQREPDKKECKIGFCQSDWYQKHEWFKTEVEYKKQKQKKPDLFIYSKDTPNQKSFGFKPFQEICISIIYLQTVNNMQNCVVKSSATAHG